MGTRSLSSSARSCRSHHLHEGGALLVEAAVLLVHTEHRHHRRAELLPLAGLRTAAADGHTIGAALPGGGIMVVDEAPRGGTGGAPLHHAEAARGGEAVTVAAAAAARVAPVRRAAAVNPHQGGAVKREIAKARRKIRRGIERAGSSVRTSYYNIAAGSEALRLAATAG